VSGLQLRHQAVEVERDRHHLQATFCIARPQLGRAIAIQLDPIPVRVVEVDRFAHPVVGSAGQRHARVDTAPHSVGEAAAIRVQDRVVVEAGAARGWRRPAGALPGVETDVVVVAAGREECRLTAEPLLQLEPEHIAVERERSVQVGNLEMHVADADLRIDWRAGLAAPVCHRRQATSSGPPIVG
jgi:hypothetical protein